MLGMVAKYAIEHWTRLPVDVELASEFRYRDPIVGPDALVIAISQSGETMDTLMALRHATAQGARTLAICNTVGSDDSAGIRCRVVHLRWPGNRGRFDEGVLDPDHRFLPGGSVSGAGAWKPCSKMRYARSSATSVICRRRLTWSWTPSNRIRDLARRFADSPSVLFLGRHVGYPVALEGALETQGARIHARRGFSSRRTQTRPYCIDRRKEFLCDRGGAFTPGAGGVARQDRPPTSRKFGPEERRSSRSPKRVTKPSRG